MSLDFIRIKEIKLIVVVSEHYKIPLRYRGEYANAPCPLPTHKEGDKGKSFSIHVGQNYWRCFSDSCNAANGGKRGGDVIAFVACMENCKPQEAARKLAEWYHVGQEKTPQRMAEGSVSRIEKPGKSYLKPSTSGESLKYMASVEIWYDEISPRRDGEDDAAYRKRMLTGIKSMFHSSYLAGQRSKGLAA